MIVVASTFIWLSVRSGAIVLRNRFLSVAARRFSERSIKLTIDHSPDPSIEAMSEKAIGNSGAFPIWSGSSSSAGETGWPRRYRGPATGWEFQELAFICFAT